MTEPIALARRNPERNLYPFNRLSLAHTLFEEWSLVRHWGRLGYAGCATLEHDETWECAPKAPRRTLQATCTRGYQGRVARPRFRRCRRSGPNMRSYRGRVT